MQWLNHKQVKDDTELMCISKGRQYIFGTVVFFGQLTVCLLSTGTGGYLHESEISEEAYAQIIADVTGEVVCTAHLAYSGDNEPHSYKLTFHLDTVYAGRTIRVYLLTDNGERRTWTVTADANGGVTFTTSDLGSFVLAVID